MFRAHPSWLRRQRLAAIITFAATALLAAGGFGLASLVERARTAANRTTDM